MKTFLTIFIVFIILSIGGFYIVLTNLTTLKERVESLEISIELAEHIDELSPSTELPPNSNPQTPTITQTPKIVESNAQTASIPTSIIFKEQSSVALLPQSNLTVTVESLSRSSDGTVKVNIKIFTNEATSYAGVEPRYLFEIIDVSTVGTNLKPVSEEGPFNSMPPKSSVSGSIIFKIPQTQNIIILQTGTGENVKYYEFNFLKKNYKETVIG
ncbi:MAG: hypothetical protein AAB617_00590 [Patescibacteria group bacterium]